MLEPRPVRLKVCCLRQLPCHKRTCNEANDYARQQFCASRRLRLRCCSAIARHGLRIRAPRLCEDLQMRRQSFAALVVLCALPWAVVAYTERPLIGMPRVVH